jgi:hypothetical protein
MISKGHMMSEVVLNNNNSSGPFGVATGLELCCLAQGSPL